MTWTKVKQEIDDVLCYIFFIRRANKNPVDLEPMIKHFAKDWSKVVESLRVNAILQFKTRGKIKL